MIKKTIASILVVGILAGCASAPTGPTIAVMPRQGQDFNQFKADNAECKQFATEEAEKTSDSSFYNGMKTVGAFVAMGALAGLMIAGGSHTAVGTGAGAGLLAGGLLGTGSQNKKEAQAQAQYNMAFQQCMYAKGNSVTGAIVK